MKWFRNTFLWASVGCLAAAVTASAQPTAWLPATVPLANEPAQVGPAAIGVRLGRPTPIAPEPLRVVNAFMPMGLTAPAGVRKAAYVARGARPMLDDEPESLLLPKKLPPLKPLPSAPFLPVQDLQVLPFDDAKIKEIDQNRKTTVGPEKLAPPRLSTPPPNSNERIIIFENGVPFVDHPSRSLFGLGRSGDRPFYVQGEWLLWTARAAHLPPLVTTASPFDPEATRGVLGSGSTRVIFGDGNTLGGLRPGARFTAGYNLDPCGLCALEGSFFFLSRKNDSAFFDSNTTPVIARPFFNINTGMQDRQLTTSPGILGGDVFRGIGNVQIAQSTTLLGAEVNHRRLLCGGCDFQLTALAGFRYLDLSEHLGFQENLTSLKDIPGITRAGDRIFVFDRFDTHNQFYGGQIGANAEWRRGPWSLDAHFKFAIGGTDQAVDIDGGQRITSLNGRVQTFRGGLYALPSNIGHFTQTRFAFVPEVGCKLGYDFTDNIRVFVGYDFLYWSSVLRPGDQIDQVLDANIIPNSGGPFPRANQVRPVVPMRTSSYWALGLNAGIEFRY
jgi:hypothetical protein